MAERTPPTVAIKQAWIEAHPFRATTTVEEREAEFNRWLAEVRREAAALTPTTLPSVEDVAQVLFERAVKAGDAIPHRSVFEADARAVLALFEKGEGRG